MEYPIVLKRQLFSFHLGFLHFIFLKHSLGVIVGKFEKYFLRPLF